MSLTGTRHGHGSQMPKPEQVHRGEGIYSPLEKRVAWVKSWKGDQGYNLGLVQCRPPWSVWVCDEETWCSSASHFEVLLSEALQGP